MSNPLVQRANEAKQKVIDGIAAGMTVEAACKAANRTVKTYEGWRANDKDFAAKVDEVRMQRLAAKDRGTNPDLANLSFAEWRKEFLGYDTYPHQQQWIDVLEGRDPIPIDGCDWDKRNPRRLIINVPPFHAKSQTLTIDYVTYRICMNPNIRIIIVSKRKEQAQKFLYAVRQRLTSSQFSKLQAAYAPEGGFRPEKGDGTFSNSVMYVRGRTADHKDPTLEVIGLGGQIYGSRADLIILDDCVVLGNANEFEKQVTWIESEVKNRVKNGTVLLIGTRLAAQDLYSELRDDKRYNNGRSPWSYLRQPMVLSYGDDPKDWVTLWPRSTTPMDEDDEPLEDGLYRAWDGPKAYEEHSSTPPAVWSLVYQQEQVSSDMTFKAPAVQGSINRRRKPGPLTAGAWGHPRHGKQGMWTVASMDPGMGTTFAIVGSVDRPTQKRYIENAWKLTNPSPADIRELIKRVTLEYGVNEWVIEEQGFQGFLVHDPELNTWLQTRGVKITPHYTGRNKIDPDFGVASCAPLFGTTHRINEGAGREVHDEDSNLIELPDPNYSAGVRALIEELITWVPGKRGKQLRQDGPMALWFFELRARVVLGHGDHEVQTKHVNLPFLMRGEAAQRTKAPFGFGVRRRIAG